MEINRAEAVVLIRVINRYLEEHPDGESAAAVRQLLERLQEFVGEIKL